MTHEFAGQSRNAVLAEEGGLCAVRRHRRQKGEAAWVGLHSPPEAAKRRDAGLPVNREGAGVLGCDRGVCREEVHVDQGTSGVGRGTERLFEFSAGVGGLLRETCERLSRGEERGEGREGGFEEALEVRVPCRVAADGVVRVSLARGHAVL